jgi:DNA (cytosine-5)-methyltransferase 1
VLENVAALLSRGLDQICGHLASVGYDTEWHCIPASAVGAPHQRDRIWIVATDAGGQQHEGGSAPLSGEIAAKLSRAFADATAMYGPSIIGDEPDRNSARIAEMANADGARLAQPEAIRGGMGGALGGWSGLPVERSGWWSAEPAVGRVADGVPYRVDRLRGLGNAVVPQIPEIIGRAIMKLSLYSNQRNPND